MTLQRLTTELIIGRTAPFYKLAFALGSRGAMHKKSGGVFQLRLFKAL